MSSDARRELAQVLKAAREERGHTVRGLASLVLKTDGHAIGGSFITDIEKMRGVPSDHIARQLAKVLHLNSEKFAALCARARAER